VEENWKYLDDENLLKGTVNSVFSILLKMDKAQNINFTAEARR
jgi:hypothetical protein